MALCGTMLASPLKNWSMLDATSVRFWSFAPSKRAVLQGMRAYSHTVASRVAALNSPLSLMSGAMKLSGWLIASRSSFVLIPINSNRDACN